MSVSSCSVGQNNSKAIPESVKREIEATSESEKLHSNEDTFTVPPEEDTTVLIDKSITVPWSQQILSEVYHSIFCFTFLSFLGFFLHELVL